MEVNMKKTDYIKFLQDKITLAQKENRDPRAYVQKLIEQLEDTHDEFIHAAQQKGHDINSEAVGQIEVEQYSAMKALAIKFGLPAEEYDEKIRQVRIRIFGEENYKRFFEEQ